MLGLVPGLVMGLTVVVMYEWMFTPGGDFRIRLILGGVCVHVVAIVVAAVAGEMHEWAVVSFCLSLGGIRWVQEAVWRREVDRGDHLFTRGLFVVAAGAIAVGMIHLAVDELGLFDQGARYQGDHDQSRTGWPGQQGSRSAHRRPSPAGPAVATTPSSMNRAPSRSTHNGAGIPGS